MEQLSHSEQDTAAIAATWAKTCRAGDVICLRGDLGAGKSVFCRALIRSLCQDQDLDVPSPTFTLVQTYDAPSTPIYHFDLYRLDDPDEIWDLGWDDALADGICLIEWPEKAGPYLPPAHIDITISATDPTTRRITIEKTGA